MFQHVQNNTLGTQLVGADLGPSPTKTHFPIVSKFATNSDGLQPNSKGLQPIDSFVDQTRAIPRYTEHSPSNACPNRACPAHLVGLRSAADLRFAPERLQVSSDRSV